MYETVLWATDGSALADGALHVALGLLQPGGRLIAFHCDERFTAGRVGGLPLIADEPDRRATIRNQVDELRADGIDAQFVVETSHHSTPGEIAKAAEVYEADVIICATRGFGLVAGAVAGSVAMRLPHLASCPVVVVSEQAARHAGLVAR